MFSFLAVSTSQAQSCRSGFAGEWETTYGKLTLSVSGDEVWGVYGTNKRISGRVYGRTLEGRWEYPNGRSGRLRFAHDGYGKFTGNWGEKDGNMNSKWTGSCVGGAVPPSQPSAPSRSTAPSRPSAPSRPTAAPPAGTSRPPGFAPSCSAFFGGTWNTNFGKMILTVRGDEARGSYGSTKTVSGRIRGNQLEGTWRYTNGRWGRFVFTHDGRGGFSGRYGEKDGPMASTWKGSCEATPPGAISSGGPPAVSGGFSGMCAPVSGSGGQGVCSDPRTEQLMNEWLSSAIPPQAPGASLRYDCWGRAIGQARTGVITANQRPDTDGRMRCNYLLDHSHLYHSSNMGTMGLPDQAVTGGQRRLGLRVHFRLQNLPDLPPSLGNR